MNETTKVTVDGRPATPHESMYLLLHSRLHRDRPPDLAILAFPWEIESYFDDEAYVHVRPKILVVPLAGRRDGPPLLAVELVSPNSTLNAKKQAYARCGVRDYWAVDPLEPSLTAFELDMHGHYHTVANITGDEPFEATRPFPVRIVLTDPLGRDE